MMMRRSLETVGRTADTELTAFTDGAPGLRSILSEAGCKKPPIADWFHIAMRLQHAKQAASGLSTDTPGRMQAKAAIVAEIERLHWRIWNGKAKNAWRTLERVRKVMHVFKGDGVHRPTAEPSSRKLWRALREVDTPISAAKVHGSSIMQTIPGWPSGRHIGDRGHRQLPGQSQDEQAAADALVTTWRRLAAAGSMRGLQRGARIWLRQSI